MLHRTRIRFKVLNILGRVIIAASKGSWVEGTANRNINSAQ